MTLPYELAYRHYQIQRMLELEPGTQAYQRVVPLLSDLSSSALLTLAQAASEEVLPVFPMYLLANHFQQVAYTDLPAALQAACQILFDDFSAALIQEQERLLQDTRLFRYPFARYLLLEEILFHQHWSKKTLVGLPDRDTFRNYLSAYLQFIQGGLGQPYLLEIWSQSGWLQRWQLGRSSRQNLPVQSSPRNAIAKYKLSESAKRLYADLDQGIANPEQFLAQLPEVLEGYLEGCNFELNARLEGALRDLVQVVMRHAMKKGFRVPLLAQALLLDTYQQLEPANIPEQQLLIYTLIQELVLGTQNLKYRLNDVLSGVVLALSQLASLFPQAAAAQLQIAQHAVLDSVMEIYESFSLAENALKAFDDVYQQSREQWAHRDYEQLAPRLLAVFSV